MKNESKGITVTITDNAGQSVTDDLQVTVTDTNGTGGGGGGGGNNGGIVNTVAKFLREHIFVSAITIGNQYNLVSGDSVSARVSFENNGDVRVGSTKVVASIPELGIRASAGRGSLAPNEKESHRVNLELPEDLEEGYYPVRFVVGHGSERRVKYREIYVEGSQPVGSAVQVDFCPEDNKYCQIS